MNWLQVLVKWSKDGVGVYLLKYNIFDFKVTGCT